MMSVTAALPPPLVLLQPPPVAITHRTPNTIQSSKPHVRDPIPTRSQLFGSFKARSNGAERLARNAGEIMKKIKKKLKREDARVVGIDSFVYRVNLRADLFARKAKAM